MICVTIVYIIVYFFVYSVPCCYHLCKLNRTKGLVGVALAKPKKNQLPKENQLPGILIFTDGACSGNPGPGGWGAVIVDQTGHVTELGGGAPQTTNNQMELAGSIFALKHVAGQAGPVQFYTDSTYVIRGITQWIWGWRKKNWQTAEGAPVLNRDSWEELSRVLADRQKKHGEGSKVEWLYSRGHVGTPGNERCDEIAVAFSQKKRVSLYSGPLLNYSVAVFDLPEDSSLPEMKPKTEKVKAHSYLSYVGGEVWRHADWASCERRVKGKSGAKFKKALKASDEAEILASWGLPSSTKIRE